jgi:hypothetical protein
LTTESIRSLLTNLIDYAGLFPPAKLDMAETVRNYAEYLASDDSWMLGRLIVPVSRLDEFEETALAALRQSAIDETTPWRISALASTAGTTELQADLVRIAGFNHKHEDDEAGLAVIDIVEMKADSVQEIETAIDQITGDLFPFFEINISEDPRKLITAMTDGDCGAKVRTGGTTAEAYPSAADLARFIHACAAANVPFKATAGMHHPLYHPLPGGGVGEGRVRAGSNGDGDSSAPSPQPSPTGRGGFEHGFLNVFIAACLALTDELKPSEIEALLEEQSIKAFAIDDETIRWRKHRLRAENIEDVREEFARSFGSCSFDEPREHLRALGLLENVSAANARD